MYFSISFSIKRIYEDMWIIDTKSNDQICCSLSKFTLYKPSTSIYDRLPNNMKVQVAHVRTICLISELKLSNIIYVPQFSFNMISISKLMNSMNYCIVFISNCYFIQDIQK